MNYSVTVIIPVYNCEKYLERAIESVIMQDKFKESELILVDDGSTDNSPVICDSYSTKYKNINVIHQSNSGVSAARNKGIEVSTGKWITFLDSDDYLLPDALNIIDKYCNSELICTSYISNEETNFNNSVCDIFGTYVIDDFTKIYTKTLTSSNLFYPCWAKFYKRSVITENSLLFPRDIKLAEDMVFVYSYLNYCKLVTVVNEATYHYYVHKDNTTSIVDTPFETYKFIYEWKTNYFSDNRWNFDLIKNDLDESFLNDSVSAFKSQATYSGFLKSISYLCKCFNDEQFCHLYATKERFSSDDITDKVLDWSIKNKNPLPFCIVSKINRIKSKLYSKIKV